MNDPLTFTVAGVPVTQGSKSAIRVGNRAVVVEGKSKQARSNFQAWRHAVATEARQAAAADARWPTDDPVVVCLSFVFTRPASHPKTRRTWPSGARSGDVDKLARAVLDAVTGVLVLDDSQVVGLSVTKTFGSRPGVAIMLWPESADERWQPVWHDDGLQAVTA